MWKPATTEVTARPPRAAPDERKRATGRRGGLLRRHDRPEPTTEAKVHNRLLGYPRVDIAGRFERSLSDVHRALAYSYDDHPDEMERLAANREASLAETRADTEAHRPPGVDLSSE